MSQAVSLVSPNSKVVGFTFGDLMVRALLRRMKCQTRRLAKYVPGDSCGERMKPRANVGDIAYVREAWRAEFCNNRLKPSQLPSNAIIRFEADNAILNGDSLVLGKYRQGRYLPQRFARIRLEIVGVGLERLQEITDADAVAEGIERVPQLGIMRASGYRDYSNQSAGFFHARDSFRSLWQSLYGDDAKKGWDANPFVWRYEFRILSIVICHPESQSLMYV